MKVAFDVDQTITRDPEMFKELMLMFKDRGHIVYVLTGNGNDYMPRPKRLAQLEWLGITEDCYDELIIAYGESETGAVIKAVAKEKGRICKERGIDILIDDMHSYCEQAKKQCGNDIVTFRVK